MKRAESAGGVRRSYCYLQSPIGRLLLVSENDRLCQLDFPSSAELREIPGEWREEEGSFVFARRQLDEYFAGRRQKFNLAIAPQGTQFQQLVWQELIRIPYGKTASYGEIARRVGRPKASRAVGMANHHNPLPIIIPCHRVIGADGSLTGFGGGLDVKKFLLDLETINNS
jgi:methylated-DNA-[protein]-cysteine S-methyltransferase